MSYRLKLMPQAEEDLEEWKRSGQKKILKKIQQLLEELQNHPTTGTGQVEQLKGDLSGYWSRRLDKSSRIVYKIEEEVVMVLIIAMKGHYGNK